jgi:AcrR family transcriptional regulator
VLTAAGGRSRGRRAQAARNDQRILESARAVFADDPAAPIAAVAEHAGVGISAIYRRYASKDELLQQLAGDGMRRYLERAEEALASDADPWDAFVHFMRRSVDEGASSTTSRLAGTFSVTDELNAQGRRIYEATQQLIDRTKAAGALRDDIEVGDLSLLFEQFQAIRLADDQRTAVLRRRYLELVLEALHAGVSTPLPGPAPDWNEISARYQPR